MGHSVVIEQSRAVPVLPEYAFARTKAMSLAKLFRKWYGPIPPIRAVRYQVGEWDTVGQTRNFILAGGGSLRETLTMVDPPKAFGYRLNDLHGPLAPLIDHVDGVWTFEPSGTGTRVTWVWTVYAKSGVAASLLPVFAQIWRGYASHALERLSDYLVD